MSPKIQHKLKGATRGLQCRELNGQPDFCPEIELGIEARRTRMKLPQAEKLSANLVHPRQSDPFPFFEEELVNAPGGLGRDVVEIFLRENTPEDFLWQQPILQSIQCLPRLEQILRAAFRVRTSPRKEIQREKQHRCNEQKQDQLNHGRAAFAKCERTAPIMVCVLDTKSS
jgi:hypothetical protein